MNRRQLLVEGWALRLCERTEGGYWVRLRRTGRVMGTLAKVRSKWEWSTWPGAFRGDGRKETRRDGDPTDLVPAGLLDCGRTATQEQACSELLKHLRTQQAPVLGYGPHPDVRPRSSVGQGADA